VDDELFDDIEVPAGELTAMEIIESGLYPRFTFFHCATRTKWFGFIPQKANLLVSAYSMTQGYGKHAGDGFLREARTAAKDARVVFVDSGLITPMLAVANGKLEPDSVHKWLERTDTVAYTAWELYKGGCKNGVIAAMDVPSTAPGREESGISFEEGIKFTLRNAITMANTDIPPGWKRVYMAQGREPSEFIDTMKMYEAEGLLDEVRSGDAWLGIGGVNKKKSPTLDNIVREVREYLGDGHIHALGVAGERIAPLAARNVVQSSDATSAVMTVTKNAGPYAIRGPRPTFLLNALWAAAAMRYDTLLARRIKELEEREYVQQDEMFLDGFEHGYIKEVTA